MKNPILVGLFVPRIFVGDSCSVVDLKGERWGASPYWPQRDAKLEAKRKKTLRYVIFTILTVEGVVASFVFVCFCNI